MLVWFPRHDLVAFLLQCVDDKVNASKDGRVREHLSNQYDLLQVLPRRLTLPSQLKYPMVRLDDLIFDIMASSVSCLQGMGMTFES